MHGHGLTISPTHKQSLNRFFQLLDHLRKLIIDGENADCYIASQVGAV